MDSIELVIKIPEEMYKWVNDVNKCFDDYGTSDFIDLVKNGIPLSKGHGKIVDIDKLIDSKCNECGHIRGVSCTIPCYEVRRLLDAPTIVEADKEQG